MHRIIKRPSLDFDLNALVKLLHVCTSTQFAAWCFACWLQRSEAADCSADEGAHSYSQGSCARDAEPTGTTGAQSLPGVCSRVPTTRAAHTECLLGPQTPVSFLVQILSRPEPFFHCCADFSLQHKFVYWPVIPSAAFLETERFFSEFIKQWILVSHFYAQ